MRLGLVSAILLSVICVPASRAIIPLGLDNAPVQTAPSNGAPWNYVAAFDGGIGSGVYLGNNYILTANHVTPQSSILLDGANYTLDASFGVAGGAQVDGVDLKLLKIVNGPNLPALPMIGASDKDLGVAATMIGWGLGKGAAVQSQGWLWGANQTHAERWASNTTLSSYLVSNSTRELQTAFEPTGGPTEGQLTAGDSGGGLFVNIGGVWKLAAIGDSGTSNGHAFFNNNPSVPGDHPDLSFFIDLKSYEADILKIVTVPEPATWALLAVTAATLGALQRPRGRGFPTVSREPDPQ